jgi:hypothetical protein
MDIAGNEGWIGIQSIDDTKSPGVTENVSADCGLERMLAGQIGHGGRDADGQLVWPVLAQDIDEE